ncbi:hypothetical protein [Algoriphagus formosus]|uniref:6-bladed beta-propeller n=1 Tax=Algoriphagus formosus TaxID=2007308 RepID=A0A4R5VCJ8_9BACT|nr:hypothetical protein [Algoriphagus aquimaris]TDK49929.1 hypothetical protein E1898_02085 [Algoriphagus aquimaris]
MRFNIILFSILLGFLVACGEAESEKPKAPLSEQELKFEIYDSLVVDYLGNLMLMDISPDGQNYLMIDQNTDTIFVTDTQGEIKHKYYRNGDDPEAIPGNRTGLGKFLDNQTILIPGSQGIATYEISGKLKKVFKPEFTGMSSLVIPFNQVHDASGQKVYIYLPGRYSDLGQQGLDFQKNSKRLEVLDLNSGVFESVMPFPKESKYSSETQEFGSLDFYTTFKIEGDSLFLFFRNEPKLFTYHLSNLEKPARVKSIPYPEFIERKVDDKPVNGGFNMRDFFLGTNLSLFPTESGDFLIQYLTGLTDEEANEVTSAAGTDFNKMFEDAEKYNGGGFVLFDGSQLSPIIEKPEILGTLNKYVSKDEIWFSLNFSEAENDYSVIYKTRLVNQ